MFKSQAHHEEFWSKRKINWKTDYFDTWDHPHRDLLMQVIKQFPLGSILELGCGAGANLYRIAKELPHVALGGVDINADAIICAQENLPPNSILQVSKLDNLFFSDKSTDVTLTDMSLIYIANIDKTIQEIKRITRNQVILCEFHSTSFWKRLGLKLATGYRAYNWKNLLEKHDFYDIQMWKVPQEAWPGGEPQKTFAYIITAKV